jgi:predicted phosphodiesterase
MRYAVLADIHSNLTALQVVLADMELFHVDGILVAGDSVNGGPFPAEVMDLLWERDARLVRGNAENYLLSLRGGVFTPAAWDSAQWAVSRWTYARLGEDRLARLAALPEQDVLDQPGAIPLRIVHGSLRRDNEGLVPDRQALIVQKFIAARLVEPDFVPSLEDVMEGIPEPALACGHTHIAWVERWDGRLAFNPGSVGAPINGDNRAQYALLSWEDGAWQVDLRAVPYDLAQVRRDFEGTGLLEEGGAFARACLGNSETGVNVAWFFVQHARRLATDAGCDPSGGVPDEIWQRATDTFDWKNLP